MYAPPRPPNKCRGNAHALHSVPVRRADRSDRAEGHEQVPRGDLVRGSQVLVHRTQAGAGRLHALHQRTGLLVCWSFFRFMHGLFIRSFLRRFHALHQKTSFVRVGFLLLIGGLVVFGDGSTVFFWYVDVVVDASVAYSSVLVL